MYKRQLAEVLNPEAEGHVRVNHKINNLSSANVGVLVLIAIGEPKVTTLVNGLTLIASTAVEVRSAGIEVNIIESCN